MRIRINNVRLSLLHQVTLAQATAKKLGLRPENLDRIQVVRRAVDARRKKEIYLNYHVVAELDVPRSLLKRLLSKSDVSEYSAAVPAAPLLGTAALKERPVVIGAGPAGLLAALELAKYGYKPLLLERGQCLARRVEAVRAFWKEGRFDPNSNVQFGEGGAGTFSDGKLTTRVNDPVMTEILQAFVAAGAPEEILSEYKPHVGTDKLRTMVQGLTRQIRELGGEVRYETQVTDFIFKEGRLTGLQLSTEEILPAQAVVLACGHSARDTYAVLQRQGVALEAKSFAIGLRVEHPQALIDQAQYGDFAGDPRLGPADYQLIYHTPDKKRTAYSFCMCPGGQVVAAASETGGVVVNGMSLYHRDSGVANSALVVNVTPEDFGRDPLGGVAFQRRYEQLAYAAGGETYAAPAQSVRSFLQGGAPDLQTAVWDGAGIAGGAAAVSAFLAAGSQSTAPGAVSKSLSEAAGSSGVLTTLTASYRPGVKACALDSVLPPYVAATLRLGLADFDRKIKNFAGPWGLLTGVETRTSAPLRILRGSGYESLTHQGLYPCGEGAGYAGGIMSAALDGYHVARAVMARYKPF